MIRLNFIIIFLAVAVVSFGQVTGGGGVLYLQPYSSEIAEYKVKEFIVREILMIPDKQTFEVEINSFTASTSGELMTVVFNCIQLNKRGLIFGFWNSYLNEFNIPYSGYAFKYFEFKKAKELLENLDVALVDKKTILSRDNANLSKNAVYKSDDTIFIFHTNEVGTNFIRVMWNGFDAGWNKTGVKTLQKRFDKFFIPD